MLCLPALCPAQTVPAYTITTIAGNNIPGFSGDGAAATAAQLDGPSSVWLDSKGNLYITDQFNNRIRMVSGANITTVAGNGTAGYSGDTFPATLAQMNGPDTVILDSKGNMFIADTQNSVVRMVNNSGIISAFAGNFNAGFGYAGDGGQANVAQLYAPAGLALDSAGNLYISDNKNNRIRMVTSAGIISTIVNASGNIGFNTSSGSPDGTAISARLDGPRGMAVDGNGALYFADTGSNMIRKVVGASITRVAGSVVGLAGSTGDGGQATNAQLHGPTAVAVDSCNNLYIADTTNSRIRMVTPDGTINTIAGTNAGYSGDTGAALSAQLNFPSGVAVDASGRVYIADTQNHVIRLLTPNSPPPCGGPQPTIKAGGVISASAFGAFPSIAYGSWIEIYGSNLAVNTRSWTAADFSGVNAPTSLDRTVVTIAGVHAFVDYISPGQVNAQVPANTGTGNLQVTVSTSAGTSAPISVNVNAVQPGLWAPPNFLVGGKQYVAATFTDGVTYVAPPNSIPGITSRQAKPGETIILYGVGFGTVAPGGLPGQIVQQANSLTVPIQFNFGGTAAGVPLYYGLAGNFVGLYEFYVVVPSVANNDLVPLSFALGSGANTTNSTQILYTAVHN
jgi:trimeric autotransporter adhesin